jgi:hypothetical protein
VGLRKTSLARSSCHTKNPCNWTHCYIYLGGGEYHPAGGSFPGAGFGNCAVHCAVLLLGLAPLDTGIRDFSLHWHQGKNVVAESKKPRNWVRALSKPDAIEWCAIASATCLTATSHRFLFLRSALLSTETRPEWLDKNEISRELTSKIQADLPSPLY